MTVSITPTPARDVREQIRKLKKQGFGNNPAIFLHSQLSNLSLIPKLVKCFVSAIRIGPSRQSKQSTNLYASLCFCGCQQVTSDPVDQT